MQINQYTMNIFAISILMAAKRGNINSRNIDKLLKHAIKITPRYKLTENHSLNIEQLYKRIFPNEDYNIDYLFLKNLHKYCGIVIEDDLHEYIVDNSSIWHDIIQLGNKIVQIDADSEVSSDIAKEKKNVVKKEILSLHQEMVIKGSICSQLFNTIENLSLETIDSYIEEKKNIRENTTDAVVEEYTSYAIAYAEAKKNELYKNRKADVTVEIKEEKSKKKKAKKD